MKNRINLIKTFPTLILFAFIILLWELMTTFFSIPVYILPSPLEVAKAFINQLPLLLFHARGTVIAALLGFLIAILIAIVLALFMDKFLFFKRSVFPLLVVSQTIPIIALAPIIMIWFGLGLLPKVLIVVLVCFFPLVINLSEGLENIDQDYLDLLLVMGAGNSNIFWHLQLPSIMPYFFSGLKIAATYSIMGAVIGEWLGGNFGLGVYMIRTMQTFHTARLFAAIMAIVILSISFFKIIEFLAWLALPWQRNNKELRGDRNV